MSRLLWICLGGAVGTGARYATSTWLLKLTLGAFPLGTLVVNIVGSLLLGQLMYLSLETEWVPETARVALSAGLMGGFTTYSSFSYESFRYFQGGAWRLGVLYVLVTVLGCLGACALGWVGARWLRALWGG